MGGANANKGLGLPRVNLINEFSLEPIIENKDLTTNSKEELVGLIVYNTNNQCTSIKWQNPSVYSIFKTGLNVWDGEKWITLSTEKNSKVGTVTDVDGNIYTTMDYEEAGVWMTENLRIRNYSPNNTNVATSFRNSLPTSPPGISNTNTVPAWSYSTNPNSDHTGTNHSLFDLDPSVGLLYSAATIFGEPGDHFPQYSGRTDVQGICPDGWHIPAFSEYEALYERINDNTHLYSNDATNANPRNLFASCELVKGYDLLALGLSKPAFEGGFDLKCYNLLTPTGTLQFNFGDFNFPPIGRTSVPSLWVTDTRTSPSIAQHVAFFAYEDWHNSGSSIIFNAFSKGQYASTLTQTILRCKKN